MKTAFERMKPELRLKYNSLEIIQKEFANAILNKYLFQLSFVDALDLGYIFDLDLNKFLDSFDI